MIKYIDNDFQEKVYTFKTPSGLNVLGVHRPSFSRSFACIGTAFGGINLTQDVDGKKFTYPEGSAHFLEHKLFEDDNEDILSQFSKLGADGNAFTSYFETVYYFSHNFELARPLNLLLNFVRSLSITQESVEKEKGIIIEELRMYDDMPLYKLLDEIRLSVYHTFPIVNDILGTQDSIQSITKEDLENAYKHNYQDSKLQMIVVSPHSAQEVYDLTVKHAAKSSEVLNVKDVFEKEDVSVVRGNYEFEANTDQTKVALAYKFSYESDNIPLDKYKLNLILESNFSDINPDYQDYLDRKIITNDFSFEIEMENGIGVIYFADDTDEIVQFKQWIIQTMKTISIQEEDFNQLSNRKYGNMIFSLSDNVGLGMNLIRYSLRKQDYFSHMEEVKKLKYEEVVLVNKWLHFNNYAMVVMKPKDKVEQ